MILLNDTEKCKGIYTWGRGEQKSAIDFILVNTLAYKLCQEMNIDEKQEKFDLSDHNLIEISLKLNDTNYQRRGKWEEKQYYRLDDESLDKYIVQLELDLETTNDITIEEFNAMVSSAASRTLKSTYRRRLSKEDKCKIEAPWVTEQIRIEIKKRRKLNRANRNCSDAEDKKEKTELYIRQKKKVQAIIRGEMHKYETKVTNDIKQDKSRGKKLWDNINKLRGKTGRNEDIQLLYDINEQPLKISEMDVEIEQYWNSIYKKHKNDIIDIWNEDSKCIYKEFIENEIQMKNIATYGNKNFPIVLREHFDSDIHIEEKVIPMEYPEITQAELLKHLNNIKKNKATGPDDVKGELYRALGRSEMCVGKCRQHSRI